MPRRALAATASVLLSSVGGCFLGDNPNFGVLDSNTDGASSGTSTTLGSSGTTTPGTTASTGTGSSGGTTSTSVGTTAGPGSASGGDGSTTTGAASYAELVLEDAPIAYWRLGEEFSTECADEIGNYPGTYVGAVGFATPGAIVGDADTAVQFGAPNTKVLFGDVLDLAGPPSFSVEAWIHPDQVTVGYPAILHKSNGLGWQFTMIDYDTMSAGFVYYYQAMSNRGVFGKVEPGVWTHVVASHDGQTLRLYVNGVEADALPTTFEIPDTDAALSLGAYSTTGGGYPGAIDEVAIYDHALLPARIKAHYDAGIGAS